MGGMRGQTSADEWHKSGVRGVRGVRAACMVCDVRSAYSAACVCAGHHTVSSWVMHLLVALVPQPFRRGLEEAVTLLHVDKPVMEELTVRCV